MMSHPSPFMGWKEGHPSVFQTEDAFTTHLDNEDPAL
jgi:hypothetical protein